MKLIRTWFVVLSLLAGSQSALAQTAEAGTLASQNRIENLVVGKAGDVTVLKIGFQQSLSAVPSHFSIANPARVVFDLPGITNGLGYSTKAVNEGALRSLNVVQAGDRSRLVLNLERLVRFEARKEGGSLTISLHGEGATTQSAGGSAQHFASADLDKGHGIRDIRFVRGQDGEGVVTVDLTSADTGVDIQQRGKKLEVLFRNTTLPEHLRRQLDVIDFATPITTVNTRSAGTDVSMEIQPKGLWEHLAFQSDNRFIIKVKPITEDPGKLFQGSKSGYQGELISLNFQNIPLRELLHVFADITNFNIVMSDSVTGNVSLRLNDVPWDQALDIVLQQRNLAMRKSDNVLWIAPRDELAARDKLAAEARDAAVAAEAPRLEVFQLSYQKAEDFAAMLTSGGGKSGDSSSASGFLSSIGKITLDKRTNQAFIYDVPSKLEMMRDLLKKIDRPARQVLIEARIVEADTSFSKRLGVRLGGHDHQGLSTGHRLLGTNTRFGISASAQDANTHLPYYSIVPTGNISNVAEDGMITFTKENVIGAAGNPNNLTASQFSNNAISDPIGQFALTLFNSAKTQLLTVELTASEADGLNKTISSPRILTADQVEAKIADGVKIPYESATASGATAVSYHDAVLSLTVTPQITPDGRVLMKIAIKKDSLGGAVPVGRGTQHMVLTKEIVSNVHVENGGTVVIGGIYDQADLNTTTRVPFLGDLPYVGFLFKMKSKEERKKELIIMLTPKIVDDGLAVKM